LDRAAAECEARVYYPALEFCTDNGAMIAFAGAMRLMHGEAPQEPGSFSVRPRWPLALEQAASRREFPLFRDNCSNPIHDRYAVSSISRSLSMLSIT
jgi:hypothetical protein